MDNYFDFTKEPGKELKRIEFEKEYTPKISVIMPFYNDKQYIESAVYSVLNQTFPAFELLIIDDGSKDEESLKKLEEVAKIDKRIKVFHKENEGLAATRDYGTKQASESSKYYFFLDSDDLIEPTYLECAYWTLETHKDASWAYTDSVGFEGQEYLWNKWYDPMKMKKINDLVATALIRKEDFNEVNGYELREKAVNEDWNFWLKMIAKGKFPVRISFYGFWYRRKKVGSELAKSRENKKRALEIINETTKKIKKVKQAIQFPRYNYNWDMINDYNSDILQVKKVKNNKINVLFIIPWMVMGGADKFNIDFINGLDKNKYDITILTTEPGVNIFRQKYKESATVYDLTTFLDQKDWVSFINYIIEKNNINLIINSNSVEGYALLPYLKAKYPELPIIDYVHMEEWYNRNGGYSRDSSGVESVIDKTLTCNQNSTNILIDYFKRKQNEVKTVYIGVDSDKFDPNNYNKEELLEKFEIDKKYVIGFICRIAAQKRPMLLVEIAKKLKERRDDFVILVAGTGDLLKKLKSKVSAYGLNDYFKFIGNIEETQKFYRVCDLTLNCSIKEGLALTSYESLSMGVPVISSDVGGQKELINEETGVIVPLLQDENDINNNKYSEEEINLYVEGIEKIINNLDNYKSKCRERVLNGFTINNMVENMNNILEDVYNNPNKTKIENGFGLSKNLNITKENIVKQFVLSEGRYEWECKQYNTKNDLGEKATRKQIFAEKMWKHSWYRLIIKILKKLGIIKFIKKLV